MIRHGESLGNTDPAYYKFPDAANVLSPKGVHQALALMEKMHTYMDKDHYGNHTKVITSEYQRAKITAEIAMSNVNLKLPITSDYRLNEVYHSDHECPEEDPEEIKHRVRSVVKHNPFNLILFCHGMLMRDVDPARGGAYNCEVRKYDRVEFMKMLES